MLFCTSETGNFLIGSIRPQQEGTSRNLTNVADDLVGWSGENMLPPPNACLFGHRRTNSSTSPEVWGTIFSDNDRSPHLPLKSIFHVSPHSLVHVQQEKNKSKNVASRVDKLPITSECPVKEALRRSFRRRFDERHRDIVISEGRSRFVTLKDQRSRLELGFLYPQRRPNQYTINN